MNLCPIQSYISMKLCPTQQYMSITIQGYIKNGVLIPVAIQDATSPSNGENWANMLN
jgi:hypothetical protein